MKYRKRPVVIEAVQWDGSNVAEVMKWAGPGIVHAQTSDVLCISTLEGVMTAQPGDWIIRGIKGELYPCKPDIFAGLYDLDEPTTQGDPPEGTAIGEAHD